eukprot:gene33082-40827_t
MDVGAAFDEARVHHQLAVQRDVAGAAGATYICGTALPA